jgi:hypothetical protein
MMKKMFSNKVKTPTPPAHHPEHHSGIGKMRATTIPTEQHFVREKIVTASQGLQNDFNKYLSMLSSDCTHSNLSKVVLDMMEHCTSRALNFMSGIGPVHNTSHHEDGFDEQLDEDLMTLTAACAKVASEFSTASEYYDTIRSSVPTFMEDFWIPERIALTLFHSTFGSGSVLFRIAGTQLREHVYGELSLMNQETRIPPSLKSWTRSMCRVTTQKPLLPKARLGFTESFYAIPEIDAKTEGLLEHVLVPGKTVIAGGSVRDTLAMRGKPLNDVDIWICGCRTQKDYEAEASRVASQLIGNVKHLYPDRCVTSRLTPGVVTLVVCSIMTENDYYTTNKDKITIDGVRYKILHRFQIIKRGFTHPMQIVLTFDMDDAKALYDGTHVYVTRTAIAALKTATSIVNPLMSTPSYRHIKQREKGMSHVFPRFNKTMKVVQSVTSLPYEELNDKNSIMREISQSNTLAGIIALGYIKANRRGDSEYFENRYQFEENTAHDPNDHITNDKYGHFGLEFADVFDDERHNKAFVSEWQIQHPGHRMYSGSAQDFFDPVTV